MERKFNIWKLIKSFYISFNSSIFYRMEILVKKIKGTDYLHVISCIYPIIGKMSSSTLANKSFDIHRDSSVLDVDDLWCYVNYQRVSNKSSSCFRFTVSNLMFIREKTFEVFLWKQHYNEKMFKMHDSWQKGRLQIRK